MTGLIDKYRERLPVAAETRPITLDEGNTPLIELDNISKDLDRGVKLYVKYEGMNPTGSFKDRGMTMAVTKAVEEGSRRLSAHRPETPPRRLPPTQRKPDQSVCFDP